MYHIADTATIFNSSTHSWSDTTTTFPNYPLTDPYQQTDWGQVTMSYTLYPLSTVPTPKKVLFYPPRTVVYWDDDTKTVVKCHKDDTFSKPLGYLMAFYEKATGLSKTQVSKALKNLVGEEKNE